MKAQLFYIHGGMTFKNNKNYYNYLRSRKISIEKKKSWTLDYLDKTLGKKFDIIRPRFPKQDNAKYLDWKIHFEKHIPFLKRNVILIGYSLGGIFLAKYLSENVLPKKALSVYLIAPPFDNTCQGEDLVGGFNLSSNLSEKFTKNTKNIYLMFSKDDEVIPVNHAAKYRRKLQNANITIFEDKNGHFSVPTFPELIKMIYTDIKKK